MPDLPRQLVAVLGLFGLDWARLQQMPEPERHEYYVKLLDWLYRILDTIDSKSSYLLRFNSITLAAQTFLVGILLGVRPSMHWEAWMLVLLIFPLFGSGFALGVYRIKWRFLGNINEQNGPQLHTQIEKELVELAKVCDKRVKSHGRVWWCSVLALGGFIVTVALTLWRLL
jgi:hypothetical protein